MLCDSALSILRRSIALALYCTSRNKRIFQTPLLHGYWICTFKIFNIIKNNDSVHAVKNVFSIESYWLHMSLTLKQKISQWLAVIMWVNLIKMLTVNFPSSWYKWYFVTKIVLIYCEKNLFYWSRNFFEITITIY